MVLMISLASKCLITLLSRLGISYTSSFFTGSPENFTYFQDLPTNNTGLMTNANVAAFVYNSYLFFAGLTVTFPSQTLIADSDGTCESKVLTE